MIAGNVLGRIRQAALERMGGSPGSHGWDHVERVWNLCRRIGTEEGANLEILEAAAYLHDVGRAEEFSSGGVICHAALGARLARKILEKEGLPEDWIGAVVHCVEAHRFRGSGPRPQSLEAKVLFDADKLDSIGAVGIGRAFLFAGEVGARLHNSEADLANARPYGQEDTAYREFRVKLVHVRDRMLTATGWRIAEGRHRFMVAFFRRLGAEVAGLK